jgi:hypothetical protein
LSGAAVLREKWPVFGRHGAGRDEPMTLFELQAWLGHRPPQSTQFYAEIRPATDPGL